MEDKELLKRIDKKLDALDSNFYIYHKIINKQLWIITLSIFSFIIGLTAASLFMKMIT